MENKMIVPLTTAIGFTFVYNKAIYFFPSSLVVGSIYMQKYNNENQPRPLHESKADFFQKGKTFVLHLCHSFENPRDRCGNYLNKSLLKFKKFKPFELQLVSVCILTCEHIKDI